MAPSTVYILVPQTNEPGHPLRSPSDWTQAYANLMHAMRQIDDLQLLMVAGVPSQALALLDYRSDHELPDKEEEKLRKVLVNMSADEKHLVGEHGYLKDWRKWYERRRDEAAAHAAQDDPKGYHLAPANRIATAFKSLKPSLDAIIEEFALQKTSTLHQKLVQVQDDYASAILGTVVPSHYHPVDHAAAASHYRELVSTWGIKAGSEAKALDKLIHYNAYRNLVQEIGIQAADKEMRLRKASATDEAASSAHARQVNFVLALKAVSRPLPTLPS
jgi:hypothetical protein